MGVEGAWSQGRCSLLFTTVLREDDYSPSQNSMRMNYFLSFRSLLCDQI